MPHLSILKNSLNMFLRLTGYHIMCMLVSISILAFFPDITGGLMAQFINIGIIVVLPYLTMWKWGDTDYNKIAHGHKKKDVWLGRKVGAIAYAPCIVLGLLLIAARAGALSHSFQSWYRFLCTPFLPLNQSLMPTTLSLVECGYSRIIISALTPLIVPISLGVAYYMGVNRISFSETFGFAKHNKKTV